MRSLEQAALQEIRKAQKPHRMAIVPVDEEDSHEEEADEQYHTVGLVLSLFDAS